jgi:hypothetical protein
MTQDKKVKYEKPTLKKEVKMIFMFNSLKNIKIGCRQCSGCHGCR